MTLFQFIRANDDRLTAESLKTNLMCWDDFIRTNSLASQKLVRETQQRLFIENDLPWVYQLTLTGEPIAFESSSLLTTIKDLDYLLYRYRYNTPNGLLLELEPSTYSSASTALLTRTEVQTEGSIALSIRILLEKLQGPDEKLSPSFVRITDDNILEMGKILRLLDNQAISVKGRMDDLTKGQVTAEKHAQVTTLLEIESLYQSLELNTLRSIYETLTTQDILGTQLDRVQRLGKKRGDYFFFNLDAKWI